MSKTKVIGLSLVAVVAILVAAYLASPFWAVRQLRAAALEGDVRHLERLVDFRTVRDGLKSQLNGAMMKKLQSDPEMAANPFAGFAMLLLPAMVERAVDAYVTPDGIAAMLAEGKPEAAVTPASPAGAKADPAPRKDKAKLSYGYDDLNTFTVTSASNSDPKSKIDFILRRQGLFGWRMTRIALPAEALAS